MDPRTPVIIGAAQHSRRDAEAEPVGELHDRVVDALADTGVAGVAARLDAVRVVKGIWPYLDPGRLVVDRLGVDARSTLTNMGGNEVYDLVTDTAARIASGDLDVVAIASAETMRTRRKDFAAGRRTEYLPERDGAVPDEDPGPDKPMSTAIEQAAGVGTPTTFYALAEIALRHRRGEAPADHLARIARLWAIGSEVAARNPDAWLPDAKAPGDLATTDDRNRPVAHPYPKLMTSNIDVDQSAAVVLCSAATAESLGVPRDRWVFPHAGAGAAEVWFPSHRAALDESPAMDLVGRTVLELAAADVDDLALLDLYSCFPVAVQLAQRYLGLEPDRPWTITGGLTFFGGPLNSYCLHALARAVTLLRESPGERALLTGNGGYFTKHSAVVLGGQPGAEPFRHARPQAEVDALGRRPDPTGAPAALEIEAYTVVHERDGSPGHAVLCGLDGAGARVWATGTDPALLDALVGGDACGRKVDLAAGGDGPVTATLAG